MKSVLDRMPQPPGALPARAQAWLLAGLTAVIAITLVTFPGQADAPDGAQGAAGSAPAAGVDVPSAESAARRLGEQAEREAERRLQRELGLPPARPDGLPRAPAPIRARGDATGAGPASGAEGASPEEQIEREERLRRYRSLRTPALVRSVRGDGGRAAAGIAAGRPAAAAETAVPAGTAPADDPDPVPPPPPAGDRGAEDPPGAYVLREGEFLEAVLVNRLSGDFAGPVNAMVSADVYDRSRQRVLVPRGTRALGAATRVEDWEQVRLAVTFHRLVLPDGAAVALGRGTGLNQVGEAGLRDLVNRHYLSTFAAAGAVGALAGLSQAASPQDAYVSRLGAARLSAGGGLSRSAERVLDRYLNRLPKVTIREGHRLRIYLTEDLALPAYASRARTGGRP